MMDPNLRATRIVQALGHLGVKPSPAATLSGMDPKNLRDTLGWKTTPTEATLLRLEATLREQAERSFRELASLALLDGPNDFILRAIGPSVARLHAALEGESDRLATAAGWPRRLGAQERQERLEAHHVDLAQIEAEEAAANAEAEGISWGAPPE